MNLKKYTPFCGVKSLVKILSGVEIDRKTGLQVLKYYFKTNKIKIPEV